MKLLSIFLNFSQRYLSNPVASLSTFVVLTSSFLLIAGYWTLMINVQSAIGSMGEDQQMTVYLKDEMSLQEKAQVESLISETKYFKKIDFVSKDQAAKNFADRLPNFAGDLTDPEFGNPLPSSYELQIQPEFVQTANLKLLGQLSEKLLATQFVDDVSYGQSWLKNYSKIIVTSKVSGYFLLFVLVFGSLMVVSFSIKNSLMQRREEIEIMELVGATHGQIRTPYVVEGAMLGLISSIIAMTLCFVLFKTQAGIIYKEIQFLGIVNGFHFLSFFNTLLFVVLGAITGALGSYLSIIKINTGWAASERSNRIY